MFHLLSYASARLYVYGLICAAVLLYVLVFVTCVYMLSYVVTGVYLVFILFLHMFACVFHAYVFLWLNMLLYTFWCVVICFVTCVVVCIFNVGLCAFSYNYYACFHTCLCVQKVYYVLHVLTWPYVCYMFNMF